MSGLLELRGVAVAHGGVVAIDGIDLDVAPREIVALVGANGAGKSTLLRAILGIDRAKAGTQQFDGRDMAGLDVAARVALGIGYAPEGRRVFAGLTVRENLDVAGSANRADRSTRIDEMEALFPDLAAKRGERAWQLSGGQQQMLAVARALMLRPRLLLLDEPSLGLAPPLVETLFATLRGIADGGVAIVLAEQNLPPALAIADRVAGLRQGRMVLDAAAQELRGDMSWTAELL